jgi:3',5'-cyclic AMP phosphodiesterase CpdA
MKTISIAVTADIHYGTVAGREDLEGYVELLAGNGIDILAIAGDLNSRGFGHRSFGEAVSILQKFPGKVLFTPGNHDLWTGKGDSFRILTQDMPAMLSDAGIHLLDGSPFVVGGLGIAGSVGWYDYSFRHVPPELESLFSGFLFRFPGNGGHERQLHWRELTTEEYRLKTCQVSSDGQSWKKSTWQDRNFIHWEHSDEAFLSYCLERLEEDLQSLDSRVDRIAVITHHLPFARFVPDIPDPTWGFHRAYLGSGRIGELMSCHPKVRHAFFGHSHRNRQIGLGGISAQNVYFHRYPGTYLLTCGEE